MRRFQVSQTYLCAGHVYGLEPYKALARTVGVFFVEPTCFASVGAAGYFDFLAVSEVAHLVLLRCSLVCWCDGLNYKTGKNLRQHNS